jgi:hypothetical protein
VKRALPAFGACALALAAPAAAKEPIRATICGASACTTVTDRSTLERIPGGEASEPLGPAAPYYRVELVASEHGNPNNQHTFSMYYVPSENAMAWAESGVVRLHPIFGAPATRLMRSLVAGLRPFPAPPLATVHVGGRKVDAAAARSYLELYELSTESALAESPTDWIRIDLSSAALSPWTDGGPDLMYSPSRDLVEHGGTRFEVSDELAADVEARRALDAASSSFPSPTLGLGALGALLLATLLRGKKAHSPRVWRVWPPHAQAAPLPGSNR